MNYWILFFLLCLLGCTHTQQNKDILFQTSPINSLLAGNYEGELTCGKLKQYGNFGLGTFNGLDGEMIMLNNEIYQAKSDGLIYNPDQNTKSPFASVTFFDADQRFQINTKITFEELKQYIDKNISSPNIIYALQINGRFNIIKVRSIPKQTMPYPPLVEIAKNQPEYSYENMEGTILGFRCPEYVAGINVPKYHFHFINKNKSRGGHVLDAVISNAEILVDNTSALFMQLPEREDFYKLNLIEKQTNELEKIEN